MFFDDYVSGLASIVPKKKSKIRNDLSSVMTLNKLVEDALHSRYDIEELPDTCDPRIIKMNLLWRCNILFVDVNDNLISLPGTENGQPTIYGKYTSGYTASLNGLFNKYVRLYLQGEDDSNLVKKVANKLFGRESYNGVCVHENWTRFPFIYYCLYYAEAIADTLRTIDVARKHIKVPYVITAEESVKDTVIEEMKKVYDNDSVVLSSGVFPVDKISVLPLDNMPESIRIATELVQWYEARFRELCTLPSNTSVDKKGENLIEAELDVTEDYALAQTESLLDVLNAELDVANKHFGTHMRAVRGYKRNERDNDIRRDVGNEGGGRALPNNNSTGTT